MNEEAWENLDASERKIASWIEDIWMMHRQDRRMIIDSWEWINLNWWTLDKQTEKAPELLREGEKDSHIQKQLREDGNKLESRILKRMDQD